MVKESKWTKNAVLLEASKHSSYKDFCRKSSGAYKASIKLGIVDECAAMLNRQTRKLDLVGHRYGKLTVMSPSDRLDEKGWLCLCDCGKHKITTTELLRSGRTKSCGCLKEGFLARKGNQYGFYEDRELAILKVQYCHMVNRNKKKGFSEVISFDEFVKLSKSACYYCGEQFSKEIQDRHNESLKGKLISDHVVKCNGIDRLDSLKGYTSDNSVPCCKTCNFAKHSLTESEFLSWIVKVYNHQFIGIEMDEGYFQIAKTRIENALTQPTT